MSTQLVLARPTSRAFVFSSFAFHDRPDEGTAVLHVRKSGITAFEEFVQAADAAKSMPDLASCAAGLQKAAASASLSSARPISSVSAIWRRRRW